MTLLVIVNVKLVMVLMIMNVYHVYLLISFRTTLASLNVKMDTINNLMNVDHALKSAVNVITMNVLNVL